MLTVLLLWEDLRHANVLLLMLHLLLLTLTLLLLLLTSLSDVTSYRFSNLSWCQIWILHLKILASILELMSVLLYYKLLLLWLNNLLWEDLRNGGVEMPIEVLELFRVSWDIVWHGHLEWLLWLHAHCHGY